MDFCNRVLNSQIDNKSPLLRSMLVIWGDSSRLLKMVKLLKMI